MSKISTATHHLTTRTADGTQYKVSFAQTGEQSWAVNITDQNAGISDQGTFCLQENGLFGIEGLEDGPEAGFPMDHIAMIQSEICQDLKKHGEIRRLYTLERFGRRGGRQPDLETAWLVHDADGIAWARAEMGNEAIIADDWDQMGPLGGSRKRLLIWADEESASNDPGQNAIAQLIVDGAIA